VRAALALVAIGLVLAAAPACRKPHGACVWTRAAPVRGVSEICRDDARESACVAGDGDASAHYTPGATCPAMGFACLGNAWDAAWRRTLPDGACPPGSSLVR